MSDETPQHVAPVEALAPAANGDEPSADGLPTQSHDTPQKDTLMADAPVDQPASSPAPVRTGTPAHGSRAASVHPDPGSFPTEAAPHGDPTRRYLNTKVTGVLLEGMKQIAKDKPNEPLRALGEYLIQKSKELEGTS